MAINRVCQKVTDSQQKYVMGLLIDFSNAFNSMEWRILAKILEVIGAPAYLRNILKSYSESRQGSVFGPLLWNIYIDDLLEMLDRDNDVYDKVAYADDVIILVEGNSRFMLERASTDVMNKVFGGGGRTDNLA
ncbi:hypothetical protein J437_LFUL014515 [Ladona fulva]|uniref:Reverse transcriptase domain-containing protein n=1 Tax=Ladona fulva TaxID=123851 RepID=A0A8K0KKW9_LADFU|nr:hypothetical protein J437_LFUL014515 [Ladona fulva]